MLCGILSLVGLKEKWPLLSEEEVRTHNTKQSLWIVAGNSVYDVTKLLGVHVGGDGALLRRGGGVYDCSEDYYFHSRLGRKEWALYKIGELNSSACASLEVRKRTTQEDKGPTYLDCSFPTSDANRKMEYLHNLHSLYEEEKGNPGACRSEHLLTDANTASMRNFSPSTYATEIRQASTNSRSDLNQRPYCRSANNKAAEKSS